MACLFSELRCKEVIDLHSGQRLGYVCDAEYEPCEGRIPVSYTHLTLPTKA